MIDRNGDIQYCARDLRTTAFATHVQTAQNPRNNEELLHLELSKVDRLIDKIKFRIEYTPLWPFSLLLPVLAYYQ